MWYISLLLACGESKQPNEKNVVLKVQKHAQPAADDFTNKSFDCCDTDQSNQFLKHYLTLTQAMAADDDSKTKEAVENLVSFTSTPEFASLATTEGIQEWVDGPKYWSTLSRKDLQQDFEPASQLMVNFAQKHKTTKNDATTTVVVAYCPMAPGRWLQTESIISNPYYGSEMLTCGVFE